MTTAKQAAADRYRERIAALEAQIKVLEAHVAELEHGRDVAHAAQQAREEAEKARIERVLGPRQQVPFPPSRQAYAASKQPWRPWFKRGEAG